MFEFTIFTELGALVVEVFNYKQSRPAPACSNPSAAAYSDPGDDPEWSEVKFYYNENIRREQITDEKFCEYLEELFIDDIIAKGEQNEIKED